MADGVAITAGSGTTIATDDSGASGHVQIVKLAVSADGSATALTADNTNGLLVDVSRITGALPAGANMIGKIDLSDGTNDAVIDVSASDAESATTAALVTNARLKVWNGSTWDRQRGFASTNKTVQQTAAQTGSAIWTPAAGKAVVITSLQIQSYGTTAGTAIVWLGGSADTTYTRGTDFPIFDGEFAPSATNKPGVFIAFPTPIRGTADFVLRLTTTNAQSITVSVWGYEI
jgi:hypothetical protein